MQVLALVLLAGLLGAIHSFISPRIQKALPATASQSMIVQALFTGGVILVALFLAESVLRVVGVGRRS